MLHIFAYFCSPPGIGNALSATTFAVVLGYYFQARRKLIVSLLFCLSGISFFIASPLVYALLNTFGLSGTFLTLAGLNAQLCVIAVICKPSTIEKTIKTGTDMEYEVERCCNDVEQCLNKEKLQECMEQSGNELENETNHKYACRHDGVKQNVKETVDIMAVTPRTYEPQR